MTTAGTILCDKCGRQEHIDHVRPSVTKIQAWHNVCRRCRLPNQRSRELWDQLLTAEIKKDLPLTRRLRSQLESARHPQRTSRPH